MDEQVVETIDDLLERLEHMEEMGKHAELQRLKAERSQLLQETELCCRTHEKTENLILEITEMLSLLQVITKLLKGEQTAAERKWLAYWGIDEGGEIGKVASYEMQQFIPRMVQFLED